MTQHVVKSAQHDLLSRRPSSQFAASGSDSCPSSGPWATCTWLGLALGLGAVASGLEWLAVAVPTQILGQVTMRTIERSHHAVWMAPLATMLVFLLLAVVLAIVNKLGGIRVRRVGLGILCTAMALAPALALEGLHPLAVIVLTLGIGIRLSGFLVHHASGMSRRGWAVLVGTLVIWVVCVSLAAWGSIGPNAVPVPAGRKSAGPNLILVVLDTVRADHLSCYGYRRPTTPVLDRLAARGVKFEQARSPAPWTLPSHATLFTGRWPHELSVAVDRALDRTHQTLAESLSDQGYQTSAFMANTYYCNRWYGLSRGFSHYEDDATNDEISVAAALRSGSLTAPLVSLLESSGFTGCIAHRGRLSAEQINTNVLSWIDGRPDPSRPFFATINYFDAHDPYIPPEGFVGPFLGQGEGPVDVWALAEPLKRVDRADPSPEDQELLEQVAGGLRVSYDNCLNYLDRQIGKLFVGLDKRGFLENTWVIITSDHGEHFGEHVLFGHGNSLYRPLTHVPLIVVPPRAVKLDGPSVIETPVSLREVPATLLSLADAPPSLPGESLSRFWNTSIEPGDAWDHPVLSEADLGSGLPTRQRHAPVSRGPMQSLVAEDRTYIRNGDGVVELYDVNDDPDEQTNLVVESDEERVLKRFGRQLDQMLEVKDPETR